MVQTTKEERRSAYLTKLRDPRWQKKRLEIFQRDEFMCLCCGDGSTKLNVHHNYYTAGVEPWEYPDTALATLCEICHEEETAQRWEEERLLLDVLKRAGFQAAHINQLSHSLRSTFQEAPYLPDDFSCDLGIFISHFFALIPTVLAWNQKRKQQISDKSE